MCTAKHTITGSGGNLLSITPLGTKIQSLIKLRSEHKHFLQENVSQNDICKMAVILLCVKDPRTTCSISEYIHKLYLDTSSSYLRDHNNSTRHWHFHNPGNVETIDLELTFDHWILGAVSLTQASLTSIEYREWIYNYINVKQRDIITSPCTIFNGGSVKPRLKLRYGRVITSHIKQWM